MFDPATVGAAVMSIYETDPSTQPDAVKALLKSGKSYYKKVPGLVSFTLLSSTDGDRILELTQWEDGASYEAYQASLATDSAADYTQYYEKYAKSSPAESLPDPQLTVVFAIERTAAPPGLKAVIAGENSLVRVSRFSTTDDGAVEPLLARATHALDQLPLLYPSPRSVVLLRGTTQSHIAVLANWGNLSEMGELNQLPPLPMSLGPAEAGAAMVAETTAEAATGETSPRGFTSWPELESVISDDHFYQVVKVVMPKPENIQKIEVMTNLNLCL